MSTTFPVPAPESAAYTYRLTTGRCGKGLENWGFHIERTITTVPEERRLKTFRPEILYHFTADQSGMRWAVNRSHAATFDETMSIAPGRTFVVGKIRPNINTDEMVCKLHMALQHVIQ
jgi:hypothetical protein